MLKGRNRLLAAAGAVAAAGAIAVSGVAAAGAASHPNVAGTESFQIMTTSATSTTSSFIAYGQVFTAGGTDKGGSKTDTITLPGGTFKITHSKGTGTQTFDPKTCLLTINQHGTYTISGGTGTYATISGNGTYKISILDIGQKSGGVCSKTLPPTTFQEVIKASGTATL
jgi:hypothetical protein